MRRNPEHAIAILTHGSEAGTRHHAENEGDRQRQSTFRIAGKLRRRRRRDHARLRDRKRLLLQRFLIALHERLIERAVGLRLSLQFPQLNHGFIGDRGLSHQTGHRNRQRLLLGSRHLRIAAIALGDALQLLVDQAIVFGHFPLQLDDLNMRASELGLQLRFRLGGREKLAAQIVDDRIRQRIRHRRPGAARAQKLVNLLIARFGARGFPPRRDDLLVDLGNLLVGNEPRFVPAGDDDAMGRLEFLDRQV